MSIINNDLNEVGLVKGQKKQKQTLTIYKKQAYFENLKHTITVKSNNNLVTKKLHSPAN